MADYSLVPVDYQPDFGDDVPLSSADEASRQPQSLYEPTRPPLQSPNSTQPMAMETNQFPGDTANMRIGDVSGWSHGGAGPVAQNDGSYHALNAGSDTYVNQVGHFETPVNYNQAAGELQSIQEAAPEKTISGTDYVSGVRDGQVTRNSYRHRPYRFEDRAGNHTKAALTAGLYLQPC